ncbi:Uncharacterised protein [Mycobacteroides abscessus subsp. abscessus]|nr:Uncharacterised protein [Mycobacteroides abscessus subsp. abscessus]
MLAAAGEASRAPGAAWVNAIRAHADPEAHGLIAQLSVAQIPAATPDQLTRYAAGILNRLLIQDWTPPGTGSGGRPCSGTCWSWSPDAVSWPEPEAGRPVRGRRLACSVSPRAGFARSRGGR